MMLEDRGTFELSLLGAFALGRFEQPLRVAGSSQRLLAPLALYGRPASRRMAAGKLWPEKPDNRAAGSLRTVIWRLPPGLVEARGPHLVLSAQVCCDVAGFVARARRLIDGTAG